MTQRDAQVDGLARPVAAVVVTPTFNNAATLPDILDRILQLGLPVIAVNDGSTDDTAATLARISATSKSVTVCTHPHNRGKASALRTGFDEAQKARLHARCDDRYRRPAFAGGHSRDARGCGERAAGARDRHARRICGRLSQQKQTGTTRVELAGALGKRRSRRRQPVRAARLSAAFCAASGMSRRLLWIRDRNHHPSRLGQCAGDRRQCELQISTGRRARKSFQTLARFAAERRDALSIDVDIAAGPPGAHRRTAEQSPTHRQTATCGDVWRMSASTSSSTDMISSAPRPPANVRRAVRQRRDRCTFTPTLWPKLFYRLNWLHGKWIWNASIRAQIIRPELVDRNGAFILATTHLSHLEPFLASIALRRKIDWMTRIEFFKYRIFAILLKWNDAFAVNRQGVPVSAIRTAIARLRQGRRDRHLPGRWRRNWQTIGVPRRRAQTRCGTARTTHGCADHSLRDAWHREAQRGRSLAAVSSRAPLDRVWQPHLR